MAGFGKATARICDRHAAEYDRHSHTASPWIECLEGFLNALVGDKGDPTTEKTMIQGLGLDGVKPLPAQRTNPLTRERASRRAVAGRSPS
jgi:hypothetical protein